MDKPRQTIWVCRATAPDQPVRYGMEDTIDCEPLLSGWQRRVADIFAEQASAEAVAGEGAPAWIAAGAALTLRQVLPALLHVRYGVALPADLQARLQACDLSILQALQTAVETCAILEGWLRHLPAVDPSQ